MVLFSLFIEKVAEKNGRRLSPLFAPLPVMI